MTVDEGESRVEMQGRLNHVPLSLPTVREQDCPDHEPLVHDSVRDSLPALRAVETWLQTLHVYGAAGIAAFGWAMCRMMGADARPWLPMWFCAALLLYNTDRLRHDPSDGINTPKREESARKLRPWGWALIAASAVALLVLPIQHGDWLTLVLTVGGSVVCLNYSVPVRGFRLKDIPLLKTFFAPSLVVAAVFGLPLLHAQAHLGVRCVLLILWASTILFSNMVLCDLRDVPGDVKCGVVSVPSRLGPGRTRRLLWILAAATASIGVLLAVFQPAPGFPWLRLTLAASAYLASLIVAVDRARSERFYEWCVEGILFVPALALLPG